LRIVLDTNAALSGLLWGGAPAHLILAARTGRVSLFTSSELIAELSEVIGRAKFRRRLSLAGLSPLGIVLDYARLAHIVAPAPLSPPVGLRDPDDVHVLACAVEAGADIIASGDRGLRRLLDFQGIPILSPADCLARIGEPSAR
jgi:uncharacterized protein